MALIHLISSSSEPLILAKVKVKHLAKQATQHFLLGVVGDQTRPERILIVELIRSLETRLQMNAHVALCLRLHCRHSKDIASCNSFQAR